MSKLFHAQKELGKISRRDFLRLTGAAAIGMLGMGCQSDEQPDAGGVTQGSTAPEINPNAEQIARVAIAQAQDYNEETLDNRIAQLLDQLGGLGDIVSSGDAVALKVNLTGGTKSGAIPGYTAMDTFVTHPLVVKSLIKQVQAAGAKEIFIVEAVYEWDSYKLWGYEEIAEATQAKLIDLNESAPYSDFVEVSVGDGNLVYPSFTFNQLLQDVDVFMSVSKMKNHYSAGVTHTMKNLYGLVPYRFYRLNGSDNYRSSFHGEAKETRARLPRIIVDLNRARSVDFGLVDGVKTTEAGEGPWIATITPIKPGLLVAGKNPVATDAVSTALMTHDPMGEYPDAPYIRCENHLNIASSTGLGPNNLDEIEVVGAEIEKVRVEFSPAW